MSCFFKVENDTTELKQCPTIEKYVNLLRDLLKMELTMDVIHQNLKYLTVGKHMKWIF